MNTGYRREGSKSRGLIIHASITTPSPMSSSRNSVGWEIVASARRRTSALSSRTRTTRWSGRLISAVTGGVSKVEYV